ncbi:MAG: HPr family phosphocarrier protein [Christensenellales bacterium]|jgi:phosphotransferase system HPr (HPr) family protein
MIEIPIDLDGLLPFNRLTAIKIAEAADRFKSECLFRSPKGEINIKSILGVMSLKAEKGTRLYISGVDEKTACETILDLLNSIKVKSCRE